MQTSATSDETNTKNASHRGVGILQNAGRQWEYTIARCGVSRVNEVLSESRIIPCVTVRRTHNDFIENHFI